MKRICLVIVDMQKGFINEHTRHLPQKIAGFIRRNPIGDVFATRYCNTPETACYKLGDCTVIADLCGTTLGEEKHNNAVELMRDNITSERVINSQDF